MITNLLRLKELKEALAADAVPQKHYFWCLFLLLWSEGLVLVVLPALGAYKQSSTPIADNLESLLTFAVSLMGTYWCYRANGGNSGKNFLGRFLALSVAVGLDVMKIIFPIWFSAIAVLSFMGKDFKDPFFGTVFVAVIFWRLSVQIKEVAGTSAAV